MPPPIPDDDAPGSEHNGRRVTILGERDTAACSPPFVRALRNLSPTLRRWAIARACLQPWRAHTDDSLSCFILEFDYATSLVLEELWANEALLAALDAELFPSGSSDPISEVLLLQLAAMPPASRQASLLQSLAASDLGAAWVRRDLEHALHLERAEHNWNKEEDE